MQDRLHRTVIAAAAAFLLLSVAAAVARTPSLTLRTKQNAAIGARILANPHLRTLYRLRPETTRQLLCTSDSCLSFWKPLTVASRSTRVHLPSGVHGSVSFVKRGRRYQVALSGHPLYTFSGDSKTADATGQNIHSFGGTWLVIKAASKAANPAPAPPPSYYPPY